MTGFYLTSADFYLIQRALEHSGESDCNCFTDSERTKMNILQIKIANIEGVEEDDKDMENFVREFGEI